MCCQSLTERQPIDGMVKDTAIGAEGLAFDSRADQMGHSVANAATCHSCVAQALNSIMKI